MVVGAGVGVVVLGCGCSGKGVGVGWWGWEHGSGCVRKEEGVTMAVVLRALLYSFHALAVKQRLINTLRFVCCLCVQTLTFALADGLNT